MIPNSSLLIEAAGHLVPDEFSHHSFIAKATLLNGKHVQC
jgi:hypothetical protein